MRSKCGWVFFAERQSCFGAQSANRLQVTECSDVLPPKVCPPMSPSITDNILSAAIYLSFLVSSSARYGNRSQEGEVRQSKFTAAASKCNFASWP